MFCPCKGWKRETRNLLLLACDAWVKFTCQVLSHYNVNDTQNRWLYNTFFLADTFPEKLKFLPRNWQRKKILNICNLFLLMHVDVIELELISFGKTRFCKCNYVLYCLYVACYFIFHLKPRFIEQVLLSCAFIGIYFYK